MAWNIYPTEGAVGSFLSNPTNYLRETQIARSGYLFHQSANPNFVSWQYTLSIGSLLSVNIAAGEAFISGYYVYSDASANLAGLTASRVEATPNFIWLQLVKTGGLVTSAQFVATTSVTPPTDSVLIGSAITDGTSTTAVHTSIAQPTPSYIGSYVGNGNATRYIFLGTTPKMVYINGHGFSDFGPSGIGSTGLHFDLTSTNHVISSGDSHLVPTIFTTSYGFNVSNGVTGSLNEDGITFYYMAWF